MSKRLKASLFGLVISLNFALRYPTVPHQIGVDGYFHHFLANDMIANGQHTWWLHPLSAFGLYPASYASGTHTLVGGIVMISGMNMEEAILFYSFLMGTLMFLFSYLFGTEIFRKDSSAILFGFIFSTSMLLLYVSTWILSVRGTFIMVFPLFLWSLLRYRDSEDFRSKMTYFLMTTFLFVFMVSLHHLYTFLLPLLLSFYISNRIYRSKNEFILRSRWFFPILFALFMVGWMFFLLVEINSTIANLFKGGFIQDLGQKIMYSTILYARNLGIVGLIALPGIFITFVNRHKNNNSLFILFMLIFVTPFFLISSYLMFILFPFICWLAVLGIEHLHRLFRSNTLRKTLTTAAAVTVLLSSSTFFQITSFNVAEPYSGKTAFRNARYVEENTFDMAMWTGEMTNGSMIASHPNLFNMRISSYSGNFVLNAFEVLAVTEDYSEFENMEVEFENPFTIRFWQSYHFKSDATRHLLFVARNMYNFNVTESKFSIEKFKYGFKYVIEDGKASPTIPEDETVFTTSVHHSKYCLYKNERGSLWML